MINVLIALLVGLFAGAHVATWGMYKDAIYEGFTFRKYSRSILVSGAIAIIVYLVTDLNVKEASNMVILYGLTYIIERLVVEFYKNFLREEDQSKYFIPMQFHVFGRVIESRLVRWTVGTSAIIILLTIVSGIIYLQRTGAEIPALIVIVVIGSSGGWISAFLGAWKDAPIEGFELLKFFRSPVLALFFAFLVANFTDNYLYIFMCGVGYTVGTAETYKTFFFPSKPRGKFTGKPVHYPVMLERRKWFIPVYGAIWAAVIAAFIIAFLKPHEGLI